MILLDKIVFLYTLSNAMTIDSANRKSQLSPLKYGYFKSRIAYFLMVVLNLKELLFLSKNNYDQLKFLLKKSSGSRTQCVLAISVCQLGDGQAFGILAHALFLDWWGTRLPESG
ncbi:hypothetical protein A3196_00890 [Candidatus Thiodiazotropha endoloripes]|uniref:Uncharacterized protein n=1 Tax=Candidatus Thiodiazotropha endoloripes TaxID=1818881 RepID=A0A1E2ULI2_9GAMM|nr:hypothetical protein A3196_00890 [Candidatus Thiodiazotropha endoloripes]